MLVCCWAKDLIPQLENINSTLYTQWLQSKDSEVAHFCNACTKKLVQYKRRWKFSVVRCCIREINGPLEKKFLYSLLWLSGIHMYYDESFSSQKVWAFDIWFENFAIQISDMWLLLVPSKWRDHSIYHSSTSIYVLFQIHFIL